jgi:hypothetical protein
MNIFRLEYTRRFGFDTSSPVQGFLLREASGNGFGSIKSSHAFRVFQEGLQFSVFAIVLVF